MTLIHGPWGSADDGGDAEKRVILPPKRDQSNTGTSTGTSKELVPKVFEAEIVDEDAPQPVDLPAVPDPRRRWERPAELRPVIPDWAADPETRRDVVSWHVHRTWYGFRYHGIRSPWYAVRLAAKSPVGAARVAGAAMRWTSAAYLNERIEPVKSDPRAVTSLTIEQSRQAGIRLSILATGLLASFIGWWVLGRNHVGWDKPLIAVLLVALFGVVADRRSDRPIISAAVHVEELPKLTADMVLTALASLGITGITAAIKDGWERRAFPEPIKVDGPGWRADVDLPHGVTAADVIDKRKALASALRRPLGAVWPEPDPEVHEGRLVIWVGKQAMEKARPPAWPLAKTGKTDVFTPMPFGYDQRLRLVSVPLIEANMLIGSVPGAGKTYAVRDVLLCAGLDPRVELRIFELKGTGDLAMFEPIAHHYGAGPSEETLGNCMASLREVYDLLETRAKTIDQIAARNRAACPENKVTPELAGQRNHGLWPIVFSIDECQEIYSHPDFKDEAERLSLAIIKRGRALGIMLLLATQRPDAASLPKGISANVIIRFCLRVEGHVENDMILGSGKHRNGFKATQFTTNQRGMGWLAGATDEPKIVRTFKIDGPEAEKIVLRARVAREAAGTLSGYALGEQDFESGPDRTIIHDVLQVMAPDEDQAHSADLCERLAEAWTARYAGWDATTLALALDACGVDTKQVRAGEKRRNGRGVTRESLLDALGEPRAD